MKAPRTTASRSARVADMHRRVTPTSSHVCRPSRLVLLARPASGCAGRLPGFGSFAVTILTLATQERKAAEVTGVANKADRWWTHLGRPREPQSIAEPPPSRVTTREPSPRSVTSAAWSGPWAEAPLCGETLLRHRWMLAGRPAWSRGTGPLSGSHPARAAYAACSDTPLCRVRPSPPGRPPVALNRRPSVVLVSLLGGVRSPQTERKAAEVTGVANKADRWWTDPGRPEKATIDS